MGVYTQLETYLEVDVIIAGGKFQAQTDTPPKLIS
jgi:hypothetical protein